MSATLCITGIQTDLAWEDKATNLSTLEKKILSITEHTEIVVLPEMFSTGFSMRPEELGETMEGGTVQWMKRLAGERKIILTGSLIVQEAGTAGEAVYYNRLVWMLPTGQFGIYDKRHLFAYAGEDGHYHPGSKRLIASVNGWKINLLVCYDLRFPVWARQAPAGADAPEYDVLIYVANWPDRRIAAWTTLLRARAIENQCYVIGVNRVGKDGAGNHYPGESMVIDAMGEILYQKNGVEDIFTVCLDRSHLDSVRQKFPFWKDGDRFEITT